MSAALSDCQVLAQKIATAWVAHNQADARNLAKPPPSAAEEIDNEIEMDRQLATIYDLERQLAECTPVSAADALVLAALQFDRIQAIRSEAGGQSEPDEYRDQAVRISQSLVDYLSTTCDADLQSLGMRTYARVRRLGPSSASESDSGGTPDRRLRQLESRLDP